jgi:hypothetical protein
MSVSIILADRSVGYGPQAGAVIIDDVRTCFAWLSKIKETSGDSTQSLTIVVRNAAAAQMLETLRGRPGIEFRESDARTELSRHWNCALPAQLTTEAIEVLKLLEIDKSPNENAISTILNRAYDTHIFSLPTLSAVEEVDLLHLLVRGHTYQPAEDSVEALLLVQLREWGKQGSRIASSLAKMPNSAPWYIALLVLRNYPLSVRHEAEEALQEVFDRRPEVSVDLLSRLSLEPRHLSSAIREPLERILRPHLLDLALSSYLKAVSGVLPIELEILAGRVADKPGAIDLAAAKATFAKLEAFFGLSILANIKQQWSAAEALNVSIEEITRGKKSDQAFAELASFYVHRYLSVKEVYGSSAQAAEQLLRWNEEYAEWLVGNYHRLIIAPEAIFATDQLRNRLKVLLENGKIPILWVIDGLAWPAFIHLQYAAEHAGLFLVGEPKASLAPIPTITEIGMTALISGESLSSFAYEHPNRSNWRIEREENFQRRYSHSRIGRANNPTQVNKILSMPASVYLLQTLMVDKYIHDHDFDKALFERFLDTYFEVQCQALAEAANYPHLQEHLHDLVIIVATDHGYTDLLRQEVARLPPEFAYESNLISIDEPHHCVIEVTLPSNDTHNGNILRTLLAENNWYVIEGEGFNLPKDAVWIVPKRQQRTRGGSLRVHGRPSLEETIVPIAEFSFYQQAALKLHLSIQGKLTKDMESKITLQVTNYETWVVKDVTVEIADLGIKTSIPEIRPDTTDAVITEARPKQSGNRRVIAQITSRGGPFQWEEILVSIEQSEAERLLGEDRVADFFDEEEL